MSKANYTWISSQLSSCTCGDIGFKKNLDLVLAWKSDIEVPFRPLPCSCPLQTILLSDPVGCNSPLQIVMVTFWCTIIVSRGLSHPTLKVWIQTKRAPNCRGLSHPTGWAALPSDNIPGHFSRVEKPPDDINSCLFFINKKGLARPT